MVQENNSKVAAPSIKQPHAVVDSSDPVCCLLIRHAHWWTGESELCHFLGTRGQHLSLTLRSIRFAKHPRSGRSLGSILLRFGGRQMAEQAGELIKNFNVVDGIGEEGKLRWWVLEEEEGKGECKRPYFLVRRVEQQEEGRRSSEDSGSTATRDQRSSEGRSRQDAAQDRTHSRTRERDYHDREQQRSHQDRHQASDRYYQRTTTDTSHQHRERDSTNGYKKTSRHFDSLSDRDQREYTGQTR